MSAVFRGSGECRIGVQAVHELTGADVDDLRKLPEYDAATDTLSHDLSAVFEDAPRPKPGPPQPPVGLDRRHG